MFCSPLFFMLQVFSIISRDMKAFYNKKSLLYNIYKPHLKYKHILLVICSMTRCFPKLHIVHIWWQNLPKSSKLGVHLQFLNIMTTQLLNHWLSTSWYPLSLYWPRIKSINLLYIRAPWGRKNQLPGLIVTKTYHEQSWT